jgi:hypothetical protein
MAGRSNSRVVAIGRLVDGQVHLRNKPAFDRALRRQGDGEITVTVEPRRVTRSVQANRYYWGVVVAHLAEHTGFTSDETHEALKQLFLPKHLALTAGNGDIIGEFVIGGSTTRLDDREFSDYCRRIKQWALDSLEVFIPEPDDGEVE